MSTDSPRGRAAELADGMGGTPGASPSLTSDALNDAAYRHWAENVLEVCPHCTRSFTPEALVHHSKACTAEKPAKPRGTGLSHAALSHRLQPGKISGTERPRAGDGGGGGGGTPAAGNAFAAAQTPPGNAVQVDIRLTPG